MTTPESTPNRDEQEVVTVPRAALLGSDYQVTAVDEVHAGVQIRITSDPSWCDAGTIVVTVESPGVYTEPGSLQLDIDLGDDDDCDETQATLHLSHAVDLERLARVLTIAAERAQALGLIPPPRRLPGEAETESNSAEESPS